MSTDWIVWPIFLVQMITFILVFLPQKVRLFGLKLHPIIVVLLIAICVVIVLSLIHDSTDVLHIYL